MYAIIWLTQGYDEWVSVLENLRIPTVLFDPAPQVTQLVLPLIEAANQEGHSRLVMLQQLTRHLNFNPHIHAWPVAFILHPQTVIHPFKFTTVQSCLFIYLRVSRSKQLKSSISMFTSFLRSS